MNKTIAAVLGMFSFIFSAHSDSTFTKLSLGAGTLKDDRGFAFYLRALTDGFTGVDKTDVYMASSLELGLAKNYPGNNLQLFSFKSVPMESEMEGEFNLHLRYAPFRLDKNSSLSLNRSLSACLIGVKADYDLKSDEHTSFTSQITQISEVTFDAIGFSYSQMDGQRRFTGLQIIHPNLMGGFHYGIDDTSALRLIGVAEASISSGTFTNNDRSLKLSAIGINSDFNIESQYLFDALQGHNSFFLQGKYERLDYTNTTDSFQIGEWSVRLGYSRKI